LQERLAHAADHAKVSIAGVLRLRPVDPQAMAAALLELFDRLYSKPLLSWRAALRSALYTAIVSIIWSFEFFGSASPFIAYRENVELELYLQIILGIALSMSINAISDYLSLFLIRPWLQRSGARPSCLWWSALGSDCW
jgi:hypothetical protein